MGFFTLDLAGMVGPAGRVIAVDIQPKMLDRLKRRLSRAGLLDRVEIRLAQPESMGLGDCSGAVELAFLFYMVHEVPNPAGLFGEVAQALKPGGAVLLMRAPRARQARRVRGGAEAGRRGRAERHRAAQNGPQPRRAAAEVKKAFISVLTSGAG
jgi:ubiquinone/menaquinone biosynthesis C-methylase UbiE